MENRYEILKIKKNGLDKVLYERTFLSYLKIAKKYNFRFPSESELKLSFYRNFDAFIEVQHLNYDIGIFNEDFKIFFETEKLFNQKLKNYYDNYNYEEDNINYQYNNKKNFNLKKKEKEIDIVRFLEWEKELDFVNKLKNQVFFKEKNNILNRKFINFYKEEKKRFLKEEKRRIRNSKKNGILKEKELKIKFQKNIEKWRMIINEEKINFHANALNIFFEMEKERLFEFARKNGLDDVVINSIFIKEEENKFLARSFCRSIEYFNNIEKKEKLDYQNGIFSEEYKILKEEEKLHFKRIDKLNKKEQNIIIEEEKVNKTKEEEKIIKEENRKKEKYSKEWLKNMLNEKHIIGWLENEKRQIIEQNICINEENIYEKMEDEEKIKQIKIINDQKIKEEQEKQIKMMKDQNKKIKDEQEKQKKIEDEIKWILEMEELNKQFNN